MIHKVSLIGWLATALVGVGASFCFVAGAQAQQPTLIAEWPVLPGTAGPTSGVTTDPSGHVYVAVRGPGGRVAEFRDNGTFIRDWGFPPTGRFSYNSPNGIGVDSRSQVYVANSGNDVIQVFDSTGVLLRQWGANSIEYLAFDAHDNLYVTGSDRVREFTSTGTLLREWGTHGTGPGQFDGPLGVCVDASGNVEVGDINNRIQQFTAEGVFLRQWAMPSVAGERAALIGLAADPRGYIYAADLVHNRVQVFSLTGDLLTGWDVYLPDSIALGQSGQLFITGNSNSVYKFGALPTSVTRTNWGSLKARFR
jgi:tripartite motif-containing protein 71